MIHLFGAATPTGESVRLLAQIDLVGYSRSASDYPGWMHHADLNKPDLFQPVASTSATWISCAPIWLFAPFLHHLASNYPDRLQGLRCVIACSSSSAITKRFAANRFDQNLVEKLVAAEDLLLVTCRLLGVPCRILRPTLIYGKAGAFGDQNLSRLTQLMRRWPFLPLPAESGLRQPIHARQLAAVALYLSEHLEGSHQDLSLPECISVGGDATLSYDEMIRALQQAQPSNDPAHRCRLLSVPSRFFYFLAAPLMLHSPKSFEAVLRMRANLSGFTPAHQLLGSEAQPFPVLPLA